MSNLHRLAHYVPVTSFPNLPFDRAPVIGPDQVGTNWGKGSAFEFSARLRFNPDPSGLEIKLGKVTGDLPPKRIVLEALCTVEQEEVVVGPYESGEFEETTDTYLAPTRISFKVTTQLPKSYIGQAEPPTRTYDYLFQSILA